MPVRFQNFTKASESTQIRKKCYGDFQMNKQEQKYIIQGVPVKIDKFGATSGITKSRLMSLLFHLKRGSICRIEIALLLKIL